MKALLYCHGAPPLKSLYVGPSIKGVLITIKDLIFARRTSCLSPRFAGTAATGNLGYS